MGWHGYIVAVIYLGVSIGGFAVCRTLAQRCSGPSLNMGKFLGCFFLTALWGASQLNLSNDATVLFTAIRIPALEHNDAVKWIGFLSVFFQSACLPSSRMPRKVSARDQ